MCRKITNRWVEYREPIDLLNRSSHMEIGLYWYKKDHGSLWTYDVTDHIMVDLKTIIALTIVTFVLRKTLYELHPTDRNLFNDFINDK